MDRQSILHGLLCFLLLSYNIQHVSAASLVTWNSISSLTASSVISYHGNNYSEVNVFDRNPSTIPDTCDCCWSSIDEADPWLLLVLKSPLIVDVIHVKGRSNNYGDHNSITGLHVDVNNIRLDSGKLSGNSTDVFVRPGTIPIRSLRFRRDKPPGGPDDWYLSICELEIYWIACGPGYYGPNCDRCGHCVGGAAACDSITRNCTGGCSIGHYQPPLCDKTCPAIDNCISHQCTNTTDVRCTECEDDAAFFKPTTGGSRCERKCAWNNHYCWPGTCTDDLTKNCQCAPGFRLVARGDAETSCQLAETRVPVIQSCSTWFRGSHGELKSADKVSGATACQYLGDVYGNFQPVVLQFAMLTKFVVNISNALYKYKPYYIHASEFGVTDTTVYLRKQTVTGSNVELATIKLLTDRNSSTRATPSSSSSRNVTLPSPQYRLTDGQRLCVKYEAYAGGYLDTMDFRPWPPVLSSPVPYQKTNTTKEVCYRYDSTPPRHCLEDQTCTQHPLEVRHRIARSGMIQLYFNGWTDPIPSGGSVDHASGIESYRITVNEVLPSPGQLKIDSGIVYTKLMNSSQTSTLLNLSSASPKLYSVKLEVKDTAGNVNRARRFVLYDNSSSIISTATSPFIVPSASTNTNHTWQTHTSDICIDWTHHFYNDFYIGHPLLNPIEADPSGLIHGIYDQVDGPLPVSGTTNVHGIVRFMVSSKVDDDADFAQEIQVPSFVNQSFCHRFDVFDGQTYTLRIRAVDIVNNSYAEERAVHIDGSPPNIINIALTKDGHRQHNAHSISELQDMNVTFDALDFHSGIKSIAWDFRDKQPGGKQSAGLLSIGTITESDCFDQSGPCYCPNVGPCELYRYNVPLRNLMDVNTHDRNYVFTVNVTNNAMLSTNQRLAVSVVDSSAGLIGR